MSDSFELTSTAANAISLTQHVTLVSSTLYLYDLFLTLHLEVDLLWPSKWSLIKVLYLLQRYLPLIDTVIIVPILLFDKVSLDTCKIMFKGTAWSYLLGMSLSEVILIRRTLAVWGNNRKLRLALIVFSVCCITPVYFVLRGYISTVTYHTLPVPGLYCFSIGQAPLSYAYLCWTFLTMCDAGLLILTVIPGFRAYKSGVRQSTITQVVYRDGALYYLYIVALSAVNLAVILKLPENYATSLTSIERVAYSVLTSRVVLHIREQAYRSQVVMNSLDSVPTNINAELADLEFRRPETQYSGMR
ncbi:hypothetical protein BDN72DRAFT_903058 [Pluteus cervinus]|uniref:Uncharacterized protein n=1 Tax=Pluteus cervinus TaxID=181527 RepID=A0ACD3AAK1_9AGAR|nr:hypothetical protein BDN72DRAFT_903058 [Pluteus cervinus]